MGIPIYLWIKDDGGADIQGCVDVKNREGSIEVISMNHDVSIATDDNSGTIMGRRIHEAFGFQKEIDSSSVFFYQALTTGKRLKSAEFKYYRINDAGQEVEYMNTTLENVTVVTLMPIMYDVKDLSYKNKGHIEYIELHYEKIIWKYLDANIIYSDSWDERKTA